MCIKCGVDNHSVEYRGVGSLTEIWGDIFLPGSEGMYGSPNKADGIWLDIMRWPVLKEHLLFTCNRCGYRWITPTVDNQ